METTKLIRKLQVYLNNLDDHMYHAIDEAMDVADAQQSERVYATALAHVTATSARIALTGGMSRERFVELMGSAYDHFEAEPEECEQRTH